MDLAHDKSWEAELKENVLPPSSALASSRVPQTPPWACTGHWPSRKPFLVNDGAVFCWASELNRLRKGRATSTQVP